MKRAMIFPVLPVNKNRYLKPNTQLTTLSTIDDTATTVVLFIDNPIKNPTTAPTKEPVHGKGSQIKSATPHVPYFVMRSFCLSAVFFVESSSLPTSFSLIIMCCEKVTIRGKKKHNQLMLNTLKSRMRNVLCIPNPRPVSTDAIRPPNVDAVITAII